MSTLLIFGQGQLGNAYREYFEARKYFEQVCLAEVDICNVKAVRSCVEQIRPQVILNTAAKTNIDWCEEHRVEALAVNTLGADNVGCVAQEFGLYLVHLSSGCVQESQSAEDLHTEEDPPSPLCFYAWTKVWADNLLKDRLTKRGRGALPAPLRVLILRPRQLLSAVVSPRNALTKMLTYSQFIATANSCTVVEDLLLATEKLIEQEAVGIYNVVNPGIITPWEIAVLLKELVKPEMVFSKISKAELNALTMAKRIDCVLSTEKLARHGIVLPEIHGRLREVLTIFKANLETRAAKTVLQRVTQETNAKFVRL